MSRVGPIDQAAREMLLTLLRRVMLGRKHGPGESGDRGPCDGDCLKCLVEKLEKRLRGTSPPGDSGSPQKGTPLQFPASPTSTTLLRESHRVLNEAREMLGVLEDHGGHDGLCGKGYSAVLDHIDELKARIVHVDPPPWGP